MKGSTSYLIAAASFLVFSFFAHRFTPVNLNDTVAACFGLLYLILSYVSKIAEELKKNDKTTT